MTVMYILALTLLLVWIVRILSDLGIVSLTKADLTLMLERHGSVDIDGSKITMLHMGVFGSLRLPEFTKQGLAKIHITDVTDPEDPLPVRSWLVGTTDDEGMFYLELPLELPNGTYQYRRFEFFSCDLDGLHAPYHGERIFEFHVQFATAGDGKVYSEAKKTFKFHEKRPGYIEIQSKFDRATSTIERLVELFTTADGGATSLDDVNACIAELHAFDFEGLAESAYRRCLDAVNEASILTTSQRDLLAHIARQLLLPPELITELNDRHLRLSTMEGATDHESIGLPDGLTVEQQLEFLAAEYRKWRARVTHIDPTIAAEATARLEAIARARAELTAQQQEDP